MVETDEGFLDGDRSIFERLVDKVEEINRSTRTGESLLKLYDAKKEEEYIATRGIMAGDSGVFDKVNPEIAESAGLEETLLAANDEGHDDWLAFLTGESEVPTAPTGENAEQPIDNSRIRLMPHAEFLERGYRTLQQALEDPAYLPLQRQVRKLSSTRRRTSDGAWAPPGPRGTSSSARRQYPRSPGQMTGICI